jgi:chromosome segregation ATPase
MKPLFAAILVLGLANAAAAAPGSQSATAHALAPSAVISEASLEYFISVAGQLMQGDNSAQLKQLQAQLEALHAEKKVLLSKLAALEAQVAGAEVAGDSGKAQALQNLIQGLEANLAQMDVGIKQILQAIQKVRDDEERRREDAERAADALRKFTAAVTQVPPRDAFVKTLSPAARDAALSKARRGADALTVVARAASLTAANAASAAAAGADMQRRLVRLPTPTPTPAVNKRIAVGVK